MLEKIGKYEIQLQLGRGAMGVVYEAWDTQIERRVALKTIRTDQAEPSELPELLARFKREAQAVGRLSHPHIVTIHDYGVENGTPYIVMEYVKGRELAHDLARHARFPLEDVVRIMTQMLGALGHAHEQGVVHRDLKPANMFLLDDGSLKVVDFGIARVDGADFTVLTSQGRVLGTPAYMSPEQVSSLPVDHRTDLFAAGVILYELLVGERPFTGESVHTVKQKVLSQEPLQPSVANPALSPAWDRVVARALAKKPSARFESARQFAEAIKAAQHADRSHAEETRLKAAEANEHALRAAEERSRAEAARRAEEERREAQRVAHAEAEARQQAEALARAKAVEATRPNAAQAARAEPGAVPPGKTARDALPLRLSRAPAIIFAITAALVAGGAWLYSRTGTEDTAAKLEAARAAAEAKFKEESDKRAAAETLARAEAEKRSRLEADARAQAEQVVKAKADEEKPRAAEEKAKAVLALTGEAEKRKAEAAKKEAEFRERSEAKAKVETGREAEHASQAARKPGDVFKDCLDCPRMVVVPAGEFTMGAPEAEPDRDSNEGPQRFVKVRSFSIGRTEVTQVEWRAVMGTNPSHFSECDDCPVETVSWNDARDFARRLSAKTGKDYRLPSEAEWEYACRAGRTDRYCGGDGVADLAWYGPNSGRRTQRVAQRRPNAFGLYDMSGNVWEWTEDCWNVNYNLPPSDSSAWLTGNCSFRIYRGGGWYSSSRTVRATSREKEDIGFRGDYVGFRLVRTLESQAKSGNDARAGKTQVEFVIPMGAYVGREKVEEVTQLLASIRLPFYLESIPTKQGMASQIRVGPFSTKAAAELAHEQLLKSGQKPGNVLRR